MRLNIREEDIAGLFRSKSVTVTVTLPISVVYLFDQEAAANNTSRSRVCAGILEKGLRWFKGEQLKQSTLEEEDLIRKKAREKR